MDADEETNLLNGNGDLLFVDKTGGSAAGYAHNVVMGHQARAVETLCEGKPAKTTPANRVNIFRKHADLLR